MSNGEEMSSNCLLFDVDGLTEIQSSVLNGILGQAKMEQQTWLRQ